MTTHCDFGAAVATAFSFKYLPWRGAQRAGGNLLLAPPPRRVAAQTVSRRLRLAAGRVLPHLSGCSQARVIKPAFGWICRILLHLTFLRAASARKISLAITSLRSKFLSVFTCSFARVFFGGFRIPWGSGHRICSHSEAEGCQSIGIYDSRVAFEQSRVLLVWTRLITPNGRSIVLERQPGAIPPVILVLRMRSPIIGVPCSRLRSCRHCLASAANLDPPPAPTATAMSREVGGVAGSSPT